MHSSETCQIRIAGSVHVRVPWTLDALTTWVLLEQEDWFEDEIRFIRRYLGPGMRAIDIGANVGVYTLAAARLVGASGLVWAFEPASAPAALLQTNIAENRFSNIQLTRKALSNYEGKAAISLHRQSELNSFSRSATDGSTETVQVTSLDREAGLLGMDKIDFVKIDAEGEEENIIAGGVRFLTEQSPLVMFEVGASEFGALRSTAAAEALTRLGYDIYRLVGPDQMLMPIKQGIGGSDINLFACKSDRARKLETRGLLASYSSMSSDARAYTDAQQAFAVWNIQEADPASRCDALLQALGIARKACVEKPYDLPRLAIMARIAYHANERFMATNASTHAIRDLAADAPLGDLAVAPSPRFDRVDNGGAEREWLLAAFIENFEESRALSGYFIGVEQQRLYLLDWLLSTRFASARMERRRQLQRMRAGLQEGLKAAQILEKETADNLNPGLWSAEKHFSH